MIVKMVDIANAAGVTRQAVSAVFNHPESCRISEKTQKRIREIAREMGYVPNITARILKGGKSGSVGIICSNLQFGLSNTLFHYLIMLLKQANLSPIVKVRSRENISTLIRELELRGVDGIIFDIREPDVIPKNMALPHVILHLTNDRFDVNVDHLHGTEIAIRHLYGHGRRRIGMLAVRHHFFAQSVRATGWQQTCAALDIPGDKSLMISGEDFDFNYDNLPAILKKRRIDALFCQNDYVAGRTVYELSMRGVKIPDDIAVIGYDGMSFCDFCAPPLATVIQPMRELARTSIEILSARLTGNTANVEHANIKLAPRLYTNTSCGCPPNSHGNFYKVNTFQSIELNQIMDLNEDIFNVQNSSLHPETR